MQVVQLSFACPLRNQWHFAEASVSEVPATESRSTRHRFEKKSWSSNRFPSGKSRRRVVSPRTKTTSHGRASNSDREQQQNFGDRFSARLRAQVSFAVNANAYSIGFQVAFSDDEHGVDFHLFGPLNFAVDLVGAVVDLRADLMSAQFFQDRSCVIEQL